LVHRPRYDDWTLPKGKDEPGETPEQAAVREILEETGYRSRIVAPIGETRYSTGEGDKLVRWFAMRPTGRPQFVPDDEVDEVRWVNLEQAGSLLTYERDRTLVKRLDIERLLGTGTLFLVRHCAAGSRSHWEGDDRERPLSKKGRRQAAALTNLLAPRGIERILTSPYVRCRQSVQPLAEATGLDIEEDETLAEGQGDIATRRLIEKMAGTNAVISSHGDVIPALLDWMVRLGMPLASPFDCKKGSIWEVEVENRNFKQASYRPPPAT
jgi:8-oxo-dGTP diphosphatase